MDAFRQGLRDLGYVEGQNLRIEWRDGGGHAQRLGGLAAELVHMNVDVYRDGRSNRNARSQGSHRHDSHCDGVR